MKVTNKINIHLDVLRRIPPIDVMQGDAYTRQLEFSLYSGGEAWNVPDGVSVAVAYHGASGQGAYDTLQDDATKAYTVSGNVVTITLIPQVAAVPGYTTVSVVFTDTNGKQLTTFGVVIDVKRNPAIGAGTPENYYNLREWLGAGTYYIHIDDNEGNEIDEDYDSILQKCESGQAVAVCLGTAYDRVTLPFVKANAGGELYFAAACDGVEWLAMVSKDSEDVTIVTVASVDEAELSDEQKAYKRSNIGAVGVDGVGQVTVKNCAFAKAYIPDIVNLVPSGYTPNKSISVNASNETIILNDASGKWSLYDLVELEPETSYDFKVYDNLTETGDMITPYRIISYCYDADGKYLGNASTAGTTNETALTGVKSKRLVTLANTKTVRIQIYTSIVTTYTKIILTKTADLPDEYPEEEYVLPFVSDDELTAAKEEMKQYVDGSIANIGGEGGSVINYTGDSPYSWFYANCVESANRMYRRLAMSSAVYNTMAETEYNLMQEGDVFQHDAAICFYNSAVYCVYVNNQVNTGDSATEVNAYVRLDKLAINVSTANISGRVASHDVCKNGDVVDGLTVTSGAGVPNMVLKGGILYILWTAKCDDGKWYEMYCTYDCESGTIGTPHICGFGDSVFSCENLAAAIGSTANNDMISVNASIAYLSGYYYACACFGLNTPNGSIIRSTDLMNWEFVAVPQFEGFDSTAQFEGAMGALGSNLYLALRQTDKDVTHAVNPIVLAKLNTSGEVIDYVLLPGTTSRPSFYKRGTTELFLICPTENRVNAMCLKVSSALKDTYPLFDFCIGGNYTQCFPKSDKVFYTVRTQGTTGIRVGKYLHDTSANIGQFLV